MFSSLIAARLAMLLPPQDQQHLPEDVDLTEHRDEWSKNVRLSKKQGNGKCDEVCFASLWRGSMNTEEGFHATQEVWQEGRSRQVPHTAPPQRAAESAHPSENLKAGTV